MLNFDVYLYLSSSDSFLIYKKKIIGIRKRCISLFVVDFWLFAGDLQSFTGSSQLSFAGGLWWFAESSWSIVSGLWSLPAIVTAGTVTKHNQKIKLVKEI